MNERSVTISVNDGQSVSALLTVPGADEPRACYVFAHGAGAGMNHPFMAKVSEGLADRAIATLRYQFPYIERGGHRTDPPKVAQATVRAAVAAAARLLPGLPLFAGGKSFGGRMTSQAQAEAPMEGVRGLVFIGFPLHPVGKPSVSRAEHLERVKIPMLFLQGTRDDLAQLELLRPVVAKLQGRATLKVFEDADHSFHVRAKSGRTDAVVLSELLDSVAGWITSAA